MFTAWMGIFTVRAEAALPTYGKIDESNAKQYLDQMLKGIRTTRPNKNISLQHDAVFCCDVVMLLCCAVVMLCCVVHFWAVLWLGLSGVEDLDAEAAQYSAQVHDAASQFPHLRFVWYDAGNWEERAGDVHKLGAERYL